MEAPAEIIGAAHKEGNGLWSDELLQRCGSSPLEWARLCIQIEDKKKSLIVFNPNILQVRMSQVYETMQELQKPTRMIVLKPRQSGGSTMGTIITTYHCMRYICRAVAMADDFGNSKNLYRMACRHLDTDLFPWGIANRQSRGEISWTNGSMLEQDTAQNPKAGISATRQVAHLCLAGNTPIITEDGRLVMLEDLKIGDTVRTQTNKTATVSAWSSNGPKKTLLIKASGMPPLQCTPEHKILTKKGWVPAGKLTKKDLVAIPVRPITAKIDHLTLPTTIRKDYQTVRRSKACGAKFPLNHETGFAVGYYLAEGHIGLVKIKGVAYPKSITFTRHRSESEYTERVEKTLAPFFTSRRITQRKNSLTDQVEFYGSAMTRLFLKLCGRTEGKHLPDETWTFGEDFCRGVLLGYLAGDGSKWPESYEGRKCQVSMFATTIQSSIAMQIRDLSVSLGYGMPSIYNKKAGNHFERNCKHAYILGWNGKAAVQLRRELNLSWREPQTKIPARYQIEGDTCWIQVLSVKKAATVPVFDIEVDDPEHSYRTSSFVVSNSEVAKYPKDGVRDSYTTIANMMASLNKEGPNSVAILESTPDSACYDERTEVLTDNGWMAFKDLKLGKHAILTKNPKTNVAYYQDEWKPQVHTYTGKMVTLLARSVDLRVTANHMMYCARQKGPMKMQRADSMLGCNTSFNFERQMQWEQEGLTHYTIPEYSHNQGNGRRTLEPKHIPIDVWLPFFGFFVTEGHVSWLPGCKSVSITQKTFIIEFREAVEEFAKHMGCKVREIPHGDGAVRWTLCCAQLADHLRHFTQPKHIPRFMLNNMSASQCRNLILHIWKGDGLLADINAKTLRSTIFCGNDKEFADTFQELALKAGYSSTLRGKAERQYTVSFSERKRSMLKCGNPPKSEDVVGEKVYCVTLPKDHLLMVRRGGVAIWCGNSGYFYDQWQGAASVEDHLEGKVGNGWIKVFAAWHEFPEHATNNISEGQIRDIESTHTQAEKIGIARWQWTPQQIAWRRMVLATECGGDEQQFNIHYPQDPESCFAASGRPRFDVDGLNALGILATSFMKPKYGNLNQNEKVVTWQETASNEGSILMFEPPMEGMRYLLAVDCATGAKYTKGADPDSHAAFVLRCAYRDEMGRKHPARVACTLPSPCRIDLDVLGKLVIRMSIHYGKCLVVPERNMGIALIEILHKASINIFIEESIDLVTSKTKSIMGWSTDRENKRRCIERLATLIRESTTEHPEILPDADTINELRTFVVDERGRCAAQSGKHDDRVMALAIAVTCSDAATTLTPLVRRRRAPRDDKQWKEV